MEGTRRGVAMWLLVILVLSTVILVHAWEPASHAFLAHAFPRIVAAVGALANGLFWDGSALEAASIVLLVALTIVSVIVIAVRGVRRQRGLDPAARKVERRRVANALLVVLLAFVSLGSLLELSQGGFAEGRTPVEQRLALSLDVSPEDRWAGIAILASDMVAAREALGPLPDLGSCSAREWREKGADEHFPVEPAAVELEARACVSRAVSRLDGREFAVFFPIRWPRPDDLLRRNGLGGRCYPGLGRIEADGQLSAVYFTGMLLHELAHATGCFDESETDLMALAGGRGSAHPFVRFAASFRARESLVFEAGAAGIADVSTRAALALPPSLREELRRIRGAQQFRELSETLHALTELLAELNKKRGPGASPSPPRPDRAEAEAQDAPLRAGADWDAKAAPRTARLLTAWLLREARAHP
jgi:hypothetical protein